ncbi:MAG TPA: hypothetical protein GXX19_02905 [Syntrophomonadaceae bacterium]|nr:hypothetical protein [Syntrophomonadaceae bacterium]
MAVALRIVEEERKKENVKLVETGKERDDNKKVVLEFPYDDLATFYEYALKELGIKNPF